MEVGPQGAASPPPTSSALVAAPLATENKVEIGNATACAEVVASLVAQLRAAGGLAAFGDMEKLETALAARDREHVLGSSWRWRKGQEGAAKATRFTFDRAFPRSACQQIAQARQVPTTSRVRICGRSSKYCYAGREERATYVTTDKSYCVKGALLYLLTYD